MSAKILDGRVVREEIAKKLAEQITHLNPKPKLVIIQIGDLKESNSYINQKVKFGNMIGAIVDHKKLPAHTAQSEIETMIEDLNQDQSVRGIIVQMPIPESLNKDDIINCIYPKKDVDGLTDTNQRLLAEDNPDAIVPATAKGIISLLNYYQIPIRDKKVAVVGRSKLVGAPVASLLQNLGATVDVGHSQTEDLQAVTKPADIIVVAVGKPNLINKNNVSPNQTIVDVGISVIDSQLSIDHSRQLIGDVDFEEVSQIVAAISPVPGGVGPMTVASLFENLFQAYQKQVS